MQEEKENYKLERYYNAINIVALTATPIYAFFMYYFRDTFTWIRYPLLNLYAFIAIIILDAVFIILRKKTGKNIYYSLARYSFTTFFFIHIYATGGINSNFIIVLLFPILVSCIDLNEKSVKWTGISITTVYALFIFLDPQYLTDYSILARHIMQVIVFGMIAYYAHSMVKNALNQHYEMEEARKKSLQLIELDKMKSSFVNVTSHQLRTPLTGAKWAITSIIDENSLSSNTRDLLKQAGEKIDLSMNIINKMLKTADIKVADFYAKIKESIKPSIMINEIISDLNFLSLQNGTKVTFLKQLDNDEGTILCDKETLKASIANIIDNAIRYSPNGNVDINISERDGNSILTVSDNGIGMKDDDKEFLFQRFFRGENAIAVDPNESGIGLYITKNIVELHGGNISIDSKLGEGTRVIVTLPLQ